MNQIEKVTFEVHDSIGIISFNTPPANELELPEFISIDLFNSWIADTTLKGLIIRGMGRNFSAGGKLDTIFSISHNPEHLQGLICRGLELLQRIQNLDIPVIAAINRVCFGGGLEIALSCHIRVASGNALLAFPEVNQNLMPGMGGTVRLPALSGFSQSAKIILGGDMLNAQEAKELGIVDFISPNDQAYEYSLTLIKKMTHDRPVKVVKSIMKALKNTMELPRNEAMMEETRLFCSLVQDEAERRQEKEIEL